MSAAPNLRGSASSGVQRAAELLRAIGEDAGPVWAQLTPNETQVISEQMKRLPTDNPSTDQAALAAFLAEASNPNTETPRAPRYGSGIWSQLTERHAATLAALIRRESPHVAAWIMTQLQPRLAAQVVRMLDEVSSLAILQRILDIKPPPAAVAKLIEDSLAHTLQRLEHGANVNGHESVARIFDQLGGYREQDLLAGLDASAPGASERVRALMFTFDDLTALGAAGMQTLLVSVDRSDLTMALKGAEDAVANAFFSNLTKRAGALIREEIAALGPMRRADVEAARNAIVETARDLIRDGNIRLDADDEADELVE